MEYVSTNPLAQEFSVIHSQGEKYRTDAPTLVRLPSGRLVSSFVLFDLKTFTIVDNPWKGELDTWVKVSDDDGASWRETARFPHELGLLFAHEGRLYLLGVEAERGSLMITVSNDDGETWEQPKVVIRGRFRNTSTAKIIDNNRFYWCLVVPNVLDEFNSTDSRTAVVSADLTQDITEPDAWRISDYLTYPGTPSSLRSGLHDKPERPFPDHWLEGNMVKINGQMRVHWRLRIDRQATVGICAICTLNDDGATLDYRFKQFFAQPGAQNHFHIINDEVSGLYWMTANLLTDSEGTAFNSEVWVKKSQRRILAGERRILALYCSFDALNWLPVGYLVIWPSMCQASNYVTPIIDGDDLLFASRTAYNALNQHDNDLVTFHRVKNFRELAKPLMPDFSTVK